MRFGNEKYGRYNWIMGIVWSCWLLMLVWLVTWVLMNTN